MEKKLEDQLKSFLYVTVGATTVMIDKTKELFTELEKVGKETCATHQVNNEELKRTIKENLKNCVNITINQEDTDTFIEKMDQLSEEELAKIKAQLEKLEQQKASKEAEKTSSDTQSE